MKNDLKDSSIFFLSFYIFLGRMKKKCRSWSGVLPISVALDGMHFSCQYDCAYCPNESVHLGAPRTISRSYLSSEGTFIRGQSSDFGLFFKFVLMILRVIHSTFVCPYLGCVPCISIVACLSIYTFN